MTNYVIGATAKLIILQAIVDDALGYPQWGVNAATNEVYMPSGGERVEDVYGVTCHYADVMPKYDNANSAYYQVTEVNRDAVESALLDARLAGLTPAEALPEDWLPGMF